MHALQLEMAQDLYMDEQRTVYINQKAETVQTLLHPMFEALIRELNKLNEAT